jgi:hypothetical protein
MSKKNGYAFFLTDDKKVLDEWKTNFKEKKVILLDGTKIIKLFNNTIKNGEVIKEEKLLKKLWNKIKEIYKDNNVNIPPKVNSCLFFTYISKKNNELVDWEDMARYFFQVKLGLNYVNCESVYEEQK